MVVLFEPVPSRPLLSVTVHDTVSVKLVGGEPSGLQYAFV
jgi:hypothetical protein